MAGVRDPAFWKRFSMAVHLDEEQLQRPDLKHSDSWLARQNKKQKRRTCICWIFWLCFFIFVAAVVGVIVWSLQNDIFGGDDGDQAAVSDERDIVARAVRRWIEQSVPGVVRR